MNDEYENIDEQNSLQSIGETIQKGRSLSNTIHRNHNPKIGKTGFPTNNPITKMNNKKNIDDIHQSNEKANNINISFSDDKNAFNAVSGIYGVPSTIMKHKWLFLSICSGSLFFLILIILVAFLLKNANTLNQVSGSFYADEEYQRIYEEVNNVANEYKTKYDVTIDKYLIISVLTFYKDKYTYADNTNLELFDKIEEYGNRSKMRVMAETLAKYQIMTIDKCDMDSSSMRKIAKNDDSIGITNFWTSEISREKNYKCDSNATGKKYEISIAQGKLENENSGGVFYWNLIDEDFFKEYYPEYFSNLSGDDYANKVDQALSSMYSYYETVKKYDTTSAYISDCNGTAYWWPIGSTTTTIDQTTGSLMATGKPLETIIVSKFSGNTSSLDDGGIGISSSSSSVNIIASKAGTVVYPLNDSQINYGNSASTTSGNIYGNYVIIKHTESLYTKYSHLAPGTITVKAGDEVLQGQVIGKMGNSGYTKQTKLRFEISTDASIITGRIDPNTLVQKENPRSSCSNFPIKTTTLSKSEFVGRMKLYCTQSKNTSFCTNFANNAEKIYDVSTANGVNPELVVVTAGTEQGWKTTCGYNFYGIGISNGKDCSSGGKYGTLESGIVAYANVLKSHDVGGSYEYLVKDRYEKRKANGCDSAGYGLPGTIQGSQSIYSHIGTYRYNPGSSGQGGCYYLNIMYPMNNGIKYCSTVPTCTDYNNCPSSSKTTICEQNDYTAWQVKEKILMRRKIFGL